MSKKCVLRNVYKKLESDAKGNPDAESALKKFAKNEKEIKVKQGFNFDKLFRSFIRNFVDASGNVKGDLVRLVGKKVALPVINRFNAIAGANAESLRQYEEAQADIFLGLNSQQRKALGLLIQMQSIKDVQTRIPKQQIKALQQIVIERVGKLTRKFDKIKEKKLKTRSGKIRQERQMAVLRKAIQTAIFNGKVLSADLADAGSIANLKPRARVDKGLIRELKERRSDVKNTFSPKQVDAVIEIAPPELKALSKKFFNVMRDQLRQLFDAGLLTQEGFDAMKNGDYSKRNFVQHLDPVQRFDFGGRQITVTDSGVKALAEGSEEALQSDPKVLMMQVISRTQARIARNNANTALYNLAKTVPTVNDMVMISKEIKPFKKTRKQALGEQKFQDVPNGYTPLSVVIDGKREQMIMKNEQAQEWVSRDPLIDSQVANAIGWLSGAKLLRATATGLNPGFAATNLPRDTAHIIFTTREFSNSPTVATFQLLKQIIKVFPDVVLRNKRKDGRVTQYTKQGGGMDLLTNQGQVIDDLTGGILGRLKKVGEYVGVTSELLTRLALREQAIDNGAAPFEATQLARNYLDFSQGGRIIKALDSGIPYLSASVQGTRGLFRAAKDSPGVFAYKVAELGMVSMALFWANTIGNDEAYDSISDEEKAANFIITTPYYLTDKNGNKRFFHLNIAKDQGQRLASQLFEAMAAKMMGKEFNPDPVAQAAKDFLPLAPDSSLPPAMSAMLGYMTNTDFWRGTRIWNPRHPTPINPEAEFLPWTHPAFVAVGDATNKLPFLPSSPERLRYVTNQFFVNNNIFLDMVGFGTRQMMDELPDAKEREWIEKINFDFPILRRVFRVTKPFNVQERKKAQKVERDINTKNAFINKEFSAILNRFDKSKDLTETKQFIAKQDRVDRKKFIRRTKDRVRVNRAGPLKNSRFWTDLALMNPEARAVNFWNKLRSLKDHPEAAAELERESRKIRGLRTRSFNIRLASLRRKEKAELEAGQ